LRFISLKNALAFSNPFTFLDITRQLKKIPKSLRRKFLKKFMNTKFITLIKLNSNY